MTMSKHLLIPAALLAAAVTAGTVLTQPPATNAKLVDPNDGVTKTIEYEHNGTKLKGYLANAHGKPGEKCPGVLVVHEVWGLNDYARKRAEQLAKLGFVAFACDMFGEGRTFKHPDDAMKMYDEITKNVPTWEGRALAGIKVLKDQPNVDPSKIAVIGYCFGGSTAIRMAQSGADIACAVSFHGGLRE